MASLISPNEYLLHLGSFPVDGSSPGELGLLQELFLRSAEGARSPPHPSLLSQLPSALVMWLTDASGEFSSSPTIMAVLGSHEDGVNTVTVACWFYFSASCWTAPAVIRDISHIPQAAVLPTMADRGVDLSALPKEVRDQLAELDLELSEGRLSGFNSLMRGADGCGWS